MYPIAIVMLRQRELELESEEERRRLADVTRRLRPPLRHQLGTALIRLGTRLSPATAPDIAQKVRNAGL